MLYQLSYVRAGAKDSACFRRSNVTSEPWAEPGFARARPSAALMSRALKRGLMGETWFPPGG